MKFLVLSALAAAAVAAPATTSAPAAQVTQAGNLVVHTVMRVVDGKTRFHSEFRPLPTGIPVPSSVSLVASASGVPPVSGVPTPSSVSFALTHTTFVDSSRPTPFIYEVHGNKTHIHGPATTTASN